MARPTELSKTIEPARMLVALRRRLRAPLPIAARNCNAGRRTKCKRRLDAYGDHWASCMGSGRIQRRTKPLEHVLRKIFKEAGANVEKNPVFLRDTSVPGISQKDERQIEIVAKGLPFFNGGTICCDATMASPLDGWGHPRKGAATTAGVANEDSVNANHRTYPELVSSPYARVVVAAVEVGGRWGGDTSWLIRELARYKAEASPMALRRRTERAWAARWWTMLSVTAQDTLAASLLNDGVFRVGDVTAPTPTAVDAIYDESREETLELSRMPTR